MGDILLNFTTPIISKSQVSTHLEILKLWNFEIYIFSPKRHIY